MSETKGAHFVVATLRENLSSQFLTRSDTDRTVQPQKRVQGVKRRFLGSSVVVKGVKKIRSAVLHGV